MFFCKACVSNGGRSMRRVLSRKGQAFRKESYKFFCPTFCTLQKVGKSGEAAKGFNFVCTKPPLRRADSRFAKPRNSLRRGRFYVLFASCKKNQKARPRFANLWTPGTIQSSAGKDFVKLSGGTCRNRFCPQNTGEKALNRCDATALQRKDLGRTAKEQPCSLQTVGYGWVRICGVGCGNWRRLRTVKWLVQIDGVLVAKKTCFFDLCKANQ